VLVMATMPHQLLMLLLLTVGLPSCWSTCDISEARRAVQTGSGGPYQKLNPKARMPKMVARRAAKAANVKQPHVEEAYRVVSVSEHDTSICLIWSPALTKSSVNYRGGTSVGDL